MYITLLYVVLICLHICTLPVSNHISSNGVNPHGTFLNPTPMFTKFLYNDTHRVLKSYLIPIINDVSAESKFPAFNGPI